MSRHLLSRGSFAVLLGLLAAWVSFANLGGRSIKAGDESIHVAVVQAMVQGRKLVPTSILGAPYLEKPALKLWLSVPVVRALGEFNYSFRVIDALCATLSIVVVFVIGLLLFDSVLPAVLGAGMLLTCADLFFNHLARSAVQDSWMLLFGLLSIVGGVRLLRRIEQTGSVEKVDLALFCCGAALASMSKSVAGFFPILVIGAAFFSVSPGTLSARIRCLRQNWIPVVAGLVLAVAPLVVYMVPLLLTISDADAIILQKTIVDRFLQPGFQNVKNPWYFYIERIVWPTEYGVFSPALLSVAILWALYRSYRGHRASQVLITWLMVPLVLFSAMQTRLPWYLAPALPAMGLLIGQLFGDLVRYLRSSMSLPLRSATLLGLLVSALLVWPFAREVYEKVTTRGPRIPLDAITADMLRNCPAGDTSCVLYVGARFDPHEDEGILRLPEKIYHRRIMPISSHVAAPEAVPLGMPPARFLLAHSNSEPVLRAKFPVCARAELMPVRTADMPQRTDWGPPTVALAVGEVCSAIKSSNWKIVAR